MKISSVNPNFQGRRDNVDMAINLDDRSIRQLARIKTESENDYKKDRRISNGLIYSSALAAGLVEGLYPAKQETFLFSKRFRGLGNNVIRGMKTAGLWGAGLASLGLFSKGLNELRKGSETYREFDAKHPILSTTTNIAAAIGVLGLVDRGAMLLKNAKSPEYLQRFAVRANKFLNTNKTINNSVRFVKENIAVLPKSLKTAGKLALVWSPLALILSGVTYGIKSAGKANVDFHNNYSELKDAQSMLAQARVRELSLQNDFLMQDAKNQEDIALLKNPKAGLAKELEA